MGKRLVGAAALAIVLVGTGSGCRLFCDRYCDRRERECYDRPRRDVCDDPCRNPAPIVRYQGDDCR